MRASTTVVALVAVFGTACASPSVETPRTLAMDAALDRASIGRDWDVSYRNPGSTAMNAFDWRYDVRDGSLIVDGIEPCTLGGGWGYVSLGRSLGGPVSDFSLSLDMGWSAEGASDATNVVFAVYSEEGDVLGKLMFHDCWTGTTGEWVALPSYPLDEFWPATREQGYADYRSGYGTLPVCGSGTWTIARKNGRMSLRIDGQEVLSYVATENAARVEIAFGYYYDPAATMGELRVDRLTGSVTVLPPSELQRDPPLARRKRSSITPELSPPVRTSGVVSVRPPNMQRSLPRAAAVNDQ